MDKPNFICIGPEKTGTSWIYKNLSGHPEVKMPPVKEIRYFWEHENFGPMDSHYKLLRNHIRNCHHRHFQSIRHFFAMHARYHLRQILQGKADREALNWDMRFFFGKHNDLWYKNLFSKEKVSGDISPQYFTLSDREIKYIKQLVPEIKVISGIREPVERISSYMKSESLRKNKKKMDYITEKEFIDLLEKNTHQLILDYSPIINRWQSLIGKKNMLIYHFEELVADPAGLFRKICNFLNINYPIADQKHVYNVINKGRKTDLPEHYKRFILSGKFNPSG